MPQAVARMASRDEDAGRYQRHRPEQTLLYRIVDECYPASRRIKRSRAGHCRAMSNAILRITSNTAGWNKAFCGCAASPASPSIWLPLAVSFAVFVPVARRKVPILQTLHASDS